MLFKSLMEATGKTVLITGTSSGIGRAAAIGMARLGLDVICSVRNRSEIAELEKLGVACVHMDMSDPTSIETGWSNALALAGPEGIHGAFLNAGFGQPGALEDMPWSALEAQFRTNVFGTMELCRHAAQHMIAKRSGRIVICSSVLGFVGMRFRGAYVGSKFALEGMADVMRLELEGTGVSVSLLQPGPVFTRFRANGLQAFQKHVNAVSSRHSQAYLRLQERLAAEHPIAPFTAQADGCTDLLTHAFLSPRPKARYRWTVQTRTFALLKRLLPQGWLDAVLARG